MFCPKCKSEYIEGVTICDDCGVTLIIELATQDEAEFKDLTPIFTSSQSLEANFIRSLLGSNAIKCTIANEYFTSINALMSAAVPIKVMVRKQDAEKARSIIEQYYKDLKESK